MSILHSSCIIYIYNVDKAMVYVMVAGVKPKIVQIWGSFKALGKFVKDFLKNGQKTGRAGKNFGVFYSQNYILTTF